MKVDLHTHTTCSDGTCTPAELVHKLHGCGLRGLAITDHDTIAALHEARPVADRLGIELIPGVELSVNMDDIRIHVLGYCFDPANERLNERLSALQGQRRERMFAILDRLKALGAPLDASDVLNRADNGSVGRPHVAQALADAGYVTSYREAFRRYLHDEGPAYVPKPPFTAREGIALLHAAGGVAVLAHPGVGIRTAAITRLVELGLDGIETVHPSHTRVMTFEYEYLAEKLGLIQTGGSDYHGLRKEEARNLLRYSVPYDRLESMRRMAA